MLLLVGGRTRGADQERTRIVQPAARWAAGDGLCGHRVAGRAGLLQWVLQAISRMLEACRPFAPWVTSNSTRPFSGSVL